MQHPSSNLQKINLRKKRKIRIEQAEKHRRAGRSSLGWRISLCYRSMEPAEMGLAMAPRIQNREVQSFRSPDYGSMGLRSIQRRKLILRRRWRVAAVKRRWRFASTRFHRSGVRGS